MLDDAAPAHQPSDIPPRGWWAVLKAAWAEAGKDNISLVAAGVAFYAFSSLVPMLTALVLSYGLVAEPASVVSHVQTLTSAMPADTASIIGDQLENMSATAGTTTGVALLLALAIALYGASKGAGSVMTGLNIAYGTDETRGFVARTIIAIMLVAGAVLVMLLAMLALSVAALLETLLPSLGGAVKWLLQGVSFALAATMVALLLAVVYRYAPDRPRAKWRWITPGSALATLVWLLATAGFGIYVANFGNYNATYGSLGAVIVFLTWLYLSAYIVLLGAELNAVLEQEVAVEPAAPPNSIAEEVADAASERPSLGGLALRFAAAKAALALLGKRPREGGSA